MECDLSNKKSNFSIYREFVLADARCALVRFGTPSNDPREILENLLENKLFDGAFDICK